MKTWGSAMITVLSVIFMSGSVYGGYNDLKEQVEKTQTLPIQQAAMVVEVRNLQDQIKESRETQKQTNESVSKLADSVNSLSVSLAKLETRENKNRK